jgi:branched-chain amino acid transport system permease protein
MNRAPSKVKTIAVTGLVLTALAAAPWVLDSGYLPLLTEALLLLAMAQMWNLLAGYAGLLSLGPQIFVALGAYTLFWVSNTLQINPFWLLPLSAVAGALGAAVVAPFMFRLRDAYFSIGMWVLAEIALQIVSKTDALGGTNGLTLKTASLVAPDWLVPLTFWVAEGIAAAAVLGLYFLMRSPLGLALMSVRDNDLAATSVGVNVGRNRFIAFVLSSAGCAVAGAVHYISGLFLTPTSGFDPNWAVAMMFIVVIGGMGTIEGPVIGTVLFFALRELCTNALDLSGGWYLVVLGVVSIIVMLFAPQGLWGVMQQRLGLSGFSIRRYAPASASSASSKVSQ